MIAQGATPYLMLSIKDFDLSGAVSIMVSIHGQGKRFDFGIDRVTVTSQSEPTESLLTIHLTQQETLSLPAGMAKVQLRWKNGSGQAYTSTVEQVDVAGCLYKGVI